MTTPIPGVIYQPKNVIATYVDDYGDQREIHAPKGKNSALRRANTTDTVTLRMNRAVAILMGPKIRARRLALGISQRELCERAGFVDVNPKQRIHAMENPARAQGMRFGTLYALAAALDCTIYDLLPSESEVMTAAGLKYQTTTKIAA